MICLHSTRPHNAKKSSLRHQSPPCGPVFHHLSFPRNSLLPGRSQVPHSKRSVLRPSKILCKIFDGQLALYFRVFQMLSCLNHSRRAHCTVPVIYAREEYWNGSTSWQSLSFDLIEMQIKDDPATFNHHNHHLPSPTPPPPHNQTTFLPGLPKQTNASARQPSLFLLASLHQREPESCQHCQLLQWFCIFQLQSLQKKREDLKELLLRSSPDEEIAEQGANNSLSCQ